MENKDRYFKAMLENKGMLNETDLGEKIGLDEDETNEIIAQLLSEHSIEYISDRACSYRPVKMNKGKKKIR